jgi:AraC-like DNA-binding protein
MLETHLWGASFSESRAVSTDTVPEEEALEYWAARASERGLPFNWKTVEAQRFEAEGFQRDVGNVHLACCRTTSVEAAWDKYSVSRRDQESLIFYFMLSGAFVGEQDGASEYLTTGMACFHDLTRPFSLTFTSADSQRLVLTVPLAAVASSVSGFDRLVGKNLRQVGNLMPLLRDYAVRLVTSTPGLDRHTQERVGSNLIDLVCAVLAEGVTQAPLDLSEHKTVALMRIRRFVEQHLSDPELTPATVAEALQLSPRYMNQLLQAEGTSLVRLIWKRRLERIAADLRNAALAGRSISTIALSRGFRDFSHLSKAFRQRYGMSPREFRQSGNVGSAGFGAGRIQGQ